MSITVAEKPMSVHEPADVAYQIRCQRSWLDRVQLAADALGLSAAAYIRMVVTQRMNIDEVPKAPPKKPKPLR